MRQSALWHSEGYGESMANGSFAALYIEFVFVELVFVELVFVELVCVGIGY